VEAGGVDLSMRLRFWRKPQSGTLAQYTTIRRFAGIAIDLYQCQG
jgi:hypothetical protein